MRLDGYIRVSDSRGRSGESFISPDQQRDAITAWAKLHGHEIIALHEEMDVSGGKTDRPLLNEVMRRIESGETEGVVVWKLDRFGRTLVGCLELLKRIQEAGANFASVTDQFDISTPNGRLVLNMMLSIAQFELERIGANWADARARATLRGHHLGRSAPFGYLKRDLDGKLEPDPVTGPIVTQIFERRAAGQSWPMIRDWLQGLGSLTGSGLTWSPQRLTELVKKEVYLGVLSDSVSGTRKEGAHPSLTTRATFEAVKHRRGVRQGERAPRADTILRGLIRCAGCRYTMTPLMVREATGFSYRCARAYSAKDCPEPAMIKAAGGQRGTDLHTYVVERVFERLPEIEAQAFGTDTEVEELDAEAKAARADLNAWLSDPKIEKAAGREGFLAGAESRRQAAEEAENRRDDALRRNAGRLQQPVRRLRDDWELMTLEEQREALGTLIQAVFVRPTRREGQGRRESNELVYGASEDRVSIVWFDDPPIDVPRQGRRDYALRPFVFDHAHDPNEIRVAVA